MGPLLFSVFINDLPAAIQICDINLYADDTVLHHCSSSVDDLTLDLQSDLTRVSDWLQRNRICLNISKCSSMIIASPQKLRKPTVLHLSVNDINIQNVDVVRYLGIFIDNHLSWAHQIQTVIASAKQKLFAISRLSLPQSVMITLYKAYVMPVLEYGCIAWWSTIYFNRSYSPTSSTFIRILPSCNSFYVKGLYICQTDL